MMAKILPFEDRYDKRGLKKRNTQLKNTLFISFAYNVLATLFLLAYLFTVK